MPSACRLIMRAKFTSLIPRESSHAPMRSIVVVYVPPDPSVHFYHWLLVFHHPSLQVYNLPFLQILPIVAFLLQDWLHWFPRLFTVTSEHIRFFTFLTHVGFGFRAHVKIASRIVSSLRYVFFSCWGSCIPLIKCWQWFHLDMRSF